MSRSRQAPTTPAFTNLADTFFSKLTCVHHLPQGKSPLEQLRGDCLKGTTGSWELNQQLFWLLACWTLTTILPLPFQTQSAVTVSRTGQQTTGRTFPLPHHQGDTVWDKLLPYLFTFKFPLQWIRICIVSSKVQNQNLFRKKTEVCYLHLVYVKQSQFETSS